MGGFFIILFLFLEIPGQVFYKVFFFIALEVIIFKPFECCTFSQSL